MGGVKGRNCTSDKNNAPSLGEYDNKELVSSYGFLALLTVGRGDRGGGSITWVKKKR